MEKNILDTPYLNKSDILAALKKSELKRFYEHQNGKIIVQESDAIQVNIQLVDGRPVVKPKFPQIGNVPQVIATIVLFVLMNFVLTGGWMGLITAILLGQVFSFLWFMPKINKLKGKVEAAL